MKEKNKYYNLGKKLGKSVVGVIIALIILLAIIVGGFAIEAICLWGVANLVFALIGVKATVTFWQCLGTVILIDFIASVLKKIFFNNKD